MKSEEVNSCKKVFALRQTFNAIPKGTVVNE